MRTIFNYFRVTLMIKCNFTYMYLQTKPSFHINDK